MHTAKKKEKRKTKSSPRNRRLVAKAPIVVMTWKLRKRFSTVTPPKRKPCINIVVIRSNQHSQILCFYPRERPNSKQYLQQGNDWEATIASHNHRRSAWGLSLWKTETAKNKLSRPHPSRTLLQRVDHRHAYFSRSALRTQKTSLAIDSTWACEMESLEPIRSSTWPPWSPVNNLGNVAMKVPRWSHGARGCHIGNNNVGTMDHTSVEGTIGNQDHGFVYHRSWFRSSSIRMMSCVCLPQIVIVPKQPTRNITKNDPGAC
jgi:hypothetical protein